MTQIIYLSALMLLSMRYVAIRRAEKNGRMLIPKKLKELAGITTDGYLLFEAVVSGEKPVIQIRMAEPNDLAQK